MTTPNHILDFYAKKHEAYLHARGAFATNILIEKLDCQPNEKILEIGFGTGATLVRLLSAYRDTEFYGIETSPLMYRKAISRMRFCGIKKRPQLQLIKNPAYLPFADNFFDKIYLESVLAIQEGREMAALLTEIYRALKPAGMLFLNEAIWLDSVSKDKIAAINEACKAKFGIIQANALYPYPENWRLLLEKSNFLVLSMESIGEMEATRVEGEAFLTGLLSRIFTLWGKVKAKFHSSLNRGARLLEANIKNASMEGKYVDGKMIICRSKKSKY